MTGSIRLIPWQLLHNGCKGSIIQGNYHFMPAFLTELSPKRFGEGSTFTAVIRYDLVNLNRDNRG